MTETMFHSKYYRADKRAAELLPSGSIYTTLFDGAVVLKDVFLKASSALTIPLPQHTLVALLPVVGSVAVSTGSNEQVTLAPGQVYRFKTGSAHIIAENQYEEDTVNFFVIGIDTAIPAADDTTLWELPLTEKNILYSAQGTVAGIKAGVYDSRTKDKYQLRTPGSSMFAYVINGSFDFEERLMEYRDGLYLWNISEADFEALSENAVILVIDCSPLK